MIFFTQNPSHADLFAESIVYRNNYYVRVIICVLIWGIGFQRRCNHFCRRVDVFFFINRTKYSEQAKLVSTIHIVGTGTYLQTTKNFVRVVLVNLLRGSGPFYESCVSRVSRQHLCTPYLR